MSSRQLAFYRFTKLMSMTFSSETKQNRLNWIIVCGLLISNIQRYLLLDLIAWSLGKIEGWWLKVFVMSWGRRVSHLWEETRHPALCWKFTSKLFIFLLVFLSLDVEMYLPFRKDRIRTAKIFLHKVGWCDMIFPRIQIDYFSCFYY